MKVEDMDYKKAKDFLITTLDKWEEEETFSKIIALAAFAERWSNKGGGPAAKLKDLNKSIKGLELIIKRNKARELDVERLEAELFSLTTDRDNLQVEYEPTVKKPKAPSSAKKVKL